MRTKSVFLKTCGYSYTHCTDANEAPSIPLRLRFETLKLTCIGDKSMARYDRALSRNGNTRTVELLEVLFNEISMYIHRCLGVSHPCLWLHVILTTSRLHVFGIALKENSQSMGHAAVKGGWFRFD